VSALEPLFGLLNFAFLVRHTQLMEAFSLHVAVYNTQSARAIHCLMNYCLFNDDIYFTHTYFTIYKYCDLLLQVAHVFISTAL